MKGFIKSKLVLTLITMLLLAGAIAIPLSGSITHTHAQGTLNISEFPIPTNGNPLDITSGPDGNVWFVEFNGEKIAKITPSGAITEYAIPTSNANPAGITSGPDGNLWFTEQYGPSQIGKITPSGTFTEYPTPSCCVAPTGITSGPDGNIWFTENFGNKIAKSTTSGTITEYTIPTGNSGPVGITSGPDGNLWFTEGGANQIGKITPSGAITEYAIPTSNSNPQRITSGPDGNLWFTEDFGNKIGKITPSGTITEYPTPSGGNPIGITTGPDGNLWFVEFLGSQIGKITPSGAITEYPLPSGFGFPMGITSGPDGNLWFTEAIGNAIGRVNLHVIQKINNLNWAGYALESTSSHPQFMDVKASWTVPKAHCNFLENSNAAFWIALGSLKPAPAPLEQIGTLSTCRAGISVYFVAYQMLPAQQNPKLIHRLASPGDPITAEVKYSPPNLFTLSIQDGAPFRGWSYSKTLTQTKMTDALSTAIWAAEIPSAFLTSSLTNFGTINFSGCTTDGLRIRDGSIIDKLILVSSNSTPRATPSDLNSDGMSFSVKWLNS